jgi:hypothetical protein
LPRKHLCPNRSRDGVTQGGTDVVRGEVETSNDGNVWRSTGSNARSAPNTRTAQNGPHEHSRS